MNGEVGEDEEDNDNDSDSDDKKRKRERKKQTARGREGEIENYNRISLNWVYAFYTQQIVNTLKMKFLHKINR